MHTASPSHLGSPGGASGQGPHLRTLLLCDLVESTALIERLGDFRAAALLRRHDQMVRRLLPGYAGREIDKSDGFLLLFKQPIQAVDFALAYQRALRELGLAERQALSARVGIHVGEVLLRDTPAEEVALGAKPVDVEGLAKSVAARLMRLARPGQILLSGVAYVLAQRTREDLPLGGAVRWCAHGRYRFKGVPLPMLVHEVGEPGIAPLHAPASGSKARRVMPLWRRPGALVLEVVALLALVAASALLRLGPPAAIAFRERDWVVMGSLDNRTGDVRFDASLETALRIGLEQSRHVNVLPELKVRDTLQRMNRPPDTLVDRALGSEIALRDGARALILPTVEEVGGRLRVSLEVVDPHSRGTVYAESADGVGIESALGIVGEVSDRLRRRLGEATAAIAQASEPLASATSPSLDALRAYTLGSRAFALAKYEEARLQFEQALTLDPEFALADIAFGGYHFQRQEYDLALARWRKAEDANQRLTPRERLALRALIATVEREKDYPARWRAILDLYPDYHQAAHNYAVFMWYANRSHEGLEYARRAMGPQSITRSASTYTLGYLLLADGQVDEAIAAFQRAASLGRSGGTSVMAAAAYAVERRFDEAAATLNRERPDSPVQAVERRMLELTMALDQGRRTRVEAASKALAAESESLGEQPFRWIGLSANLAVSSFLGGDGARNATARELVARTVGALDATTAVDRERVALAMLYAAYVAASGGDGQTARHALDAASPLLENAQFGVLANLFALVQARLDAASGEYEAVLARLSPMLRGDELYLTHALLGEAYAALGRPAEGLEQMRWLVDRRGRAYAEYAGGQLLQAENIKQANLARLRIAELSLASGDAAAARKALDAFQGSWLDLSDQPELALRAAAVSRALTTDRHGR